MKAKVLKVDKKLFEGEVVKIVIPATEGEMCVLPHHMSIITGMKSGNIKLFTPSVERPTVFNISKGIFSFANDEATFIL